MPYAFVLAIVAAALFLAAAVVTTSRTERLIAVGLVLVALVHVLR